MRLRCIPADRLNAEIARRAVRGEAPVAPDLAGLHAEAVELLQEGRSDIAATLFQGALFADPGSPVLRNNLAFCMVPTNPAQAKGLFESLHSENHEPLLTLANLVAVEVALGNHAAANDRFRELVEKAQPGTRHSCVLWDTSEAPPRLVETDNPLGHAESLLKKDRD